MWYVLPKTREVRHSYFTMVQKKEKAPALKKKSQSFASMLFDVVGYGVRQAALPVPDMPKWMKKKKDAKKK